MPKEKKVANSTPAKGVPDPTDKVTSWRLFPEGKDPEENTQKLLGEVKASQTQSTDGQSSVASSFKKPASQEASFPSKP